MTENLVNYLIVCYMFPKQCNTITVQYQKGVWMDLDYFWFGCETQIWKSSEYSTVLLTPLMCVNVRTIQTPACAPQTNHKTTRISQVFRNLGHTFERLYSVVTYMVWLWSTRNDFIAQPKGSHATWLW